jgi:signal transduction histidine kinase
VKLYRKLLLFTLAAALLPLTAVGFVLLARTQRALKEQIARQQIAATREIAELVSRDLEATEEIFGQAAATWQFARLSEEELRALPLFQCKRSSRVQAAGLFDAAGREVAPAVACATQGAGGDPPPMGSAELADFRAALPLREAAQARGNVMAAPVHSGPRRRPELALVQAVGGRGGAVWIVGALFEMESLQARAAEVAPRGGTVAVLDAADAEVVSTPGVALARADAEAARRLRARGGEATSEYAGEDGVPVLAAYSAVPGSTGWGVLLRLPAAAAFAEVAELQRRVLYASFVSLLGLLLFGWIFIRGINRGLARIDAAAREIGQGNLGARLPVRGSDEVAEVSRAFNQMGEELLSARSRLERWNEELKAKVEERTRELRETQAQLLEAQKLAAIGQLGAGVAHEINNPLTGILGQAQLLLEKKRPGDPDLPALRRIEDLSRRSAEITRNLLRFSQQRLEPEFGRVDLNRVVRETLTLAEGHIREGGVALDVSLAEGLPAVRGDAGHLQQVLLNLLSNARTACRERPGARIAVETRGDGGQVCLAVRDTGKGIAPEARPRIFEPFFTTKEVWSNVGLGLSVSYRIVAEHGGRIAVESQVDQGSTFTVTLPVASATV